ncbi:class I SAM-dependent methyltransferase [Desulfurivibrio sp. C05AmB]|uniref:class I SAM-dependent methyltransferase n=1 Tax=Desulfurivibrio sp. C05AmB TaxID=3374371 RepID=UPI00376ECD49
MIGKFALPRLYTDLAWLWPLWGDPATEYGRYCDQVVRLIEQQAGRPVNSLLNIACGGGKNIFNLRKRYQVTGLDLSPAMLQLARNLNPDCELLEGDMRSFALNRTFDAILLDDGVSYLTSRAELAAAFQVAFDHLNPGGVLVVTPDVTSETFRQNRTQVTPAIATIKPANLDVVFIENVYDPDPGDQHYEATMLYLIRENGILRIETDRHLLGIFSLEAWQQTLAEAGFAIYQEKLNLDGEQYLTFAGTRPA